MTITDRDLLQGVVRGWHDRLPGTVNTVKARAVIALVPGLYNVHLFFSPLLIVLSITPVYFQPYREAVSVHVCFCLLNFS